MPKLRLVFQVSICFQVGDLGLLLAVKLHYAAIADLGLEIELLSSYGFRAVAKGNLEWSFLFSMLMPK